MKPCLGSVAVLLLVLSPVWAEAPDAKKTVAYLQKMQQDDGGFLPTEATPTAARPTSTLRATTSAIRALKYFGGELPNKEKAAHYIEAAFDKASGGFRDRSGAAPDVASTAIGLMAVIELKMPAEKYTDAGVKFLVDNAKNYEEVRIAAAGLEAVGKGPAGADAWLEMVAKMRNNDGTWGQGDGQARDTGGSAVIVLRLGGKLEHPENVIKAIKTGQRSDGAFGKADAKGSDLDTTYRVMRAFHMLKEKPADVKALRAFIDKCRNADGGYGVAPGEPSGVGPTYNSAIILHWLDE